MFRNNKKKSAIYLLTLVVLSLLGGCASNTELTVEPDKWVFGASDINLQINAPSDLNAVNGRPHAIAIGLFQLNDPNSFTSLASTREGAVDLLNRGKFDDTVATYLRVTLQPGEQRNMWINRAQGAQYVGVIAGFYQLTPALDVGLMAIPVVPLEQGIVEKALIATGLKADEAAAKPGKLFLKIELGRTETKQIINVTPESN